MPLASDTSKLDGSTASSHDANADGLFNIQDYAEDPRIDRQWSRSWRRYVGLIGFDYTFSDGVDDDGNGYIDDISGWDFFERDNDAYHTYADGFGNHGTGVARSACWRRGQQWIDWSLSHSGVLHELVIPLLQTAVDVRRQSRMEPIWESLEFTMAVGALSNLMPQRKPLGTPGIWGRYWWVLQATKMLITTTLPSLMMSCTCIPSLGIRVPIRSVT